MNNEPQQPPFEEPSVLDYFKSLFRFGRGEVTIEGQPFSESGQATVVEAPRLEEPSAEALKPLERADVQTSFPWRSLLALLLALLGQNTFEPPSTASPLGIALYLAAFALLGWAIHRGEWILPAPLPSGGRGDPLTYRRLALLFSIPLVFMAFVLFKENLFTVANLLVWLAGTALFVFAFWVERPGRVISLRFNAWSLLLVGVVALTFFFRFYRIESVPPEPFSDHAEKILDVYDVSQGQTRIFFPRNTGREALQMYWTLLVAKLFGTGLSFLSLKLGTALLGFLTLPFVYLLGKELGGARVGLFALLLAGIGYWPNVISRVGLRFPLYPLFTAATLFFLIRGLRTRHRNDFLLSGLFLGLGLHGYSPMRIVPLVVVIAFLLYGLHAQSKGVRRDLPLWLTMLALTSLFFFLPLLRYWIEHPTEFNFRAFSRLSGMEQPLAGPPAEIFFGNVWKALKMFNFDDGEIWVHSVTHRPALDVVSAALFALGVVLVLVRYLRRRHWLDLFLLVSIPLLQLPSSLSLAFPAENPALNRAGAAYLPAFLIGAMALDGLVTGFGVGKKRGVSAAVVVVILLAVSAYQNYDLVFRQYYDAFRQASWNTSDMGKVIKEFERNYGRTDTIWIVPYPHWVDTRLPAVWAGIPNRDMAMWREDLPSTLQVSGPKLFIVRANVEATEFNDTETLNLLRSLYPNGQLRLFDSDIPGHDFWMYFVPANG